MLSKFFDAPLFERLDNFLSLMSRGVSALERAYPPIDPRQLEVSKKRGPGAIIKYGRDEQGWARNEFQELIHEQGLAPDAEKAALAEVMGRWEAQAPAESLED